jgi:N-methylhydantoinase A
VPLDVDAARKGLAELAARLGLSLEDAAIGILEVSAWNQANALRQITVKRGLDVRDFTLTTFGGSGSLLLCRLVEILGLQGVLVPPNPGNVSAFGLLTVDVKNDYVRTAVRRHDDLEAGAAETIFQQLQQQAAAALAAEGFPASEQRFVRTADLRYFGQAFEVRVPVPDGALDAKSADEVAERFHDAHQTLYGYDFRGVTGQHVEWVNLRVSGIGPIRRPDLRELPREDVDLERARTGTRLVCFDDGYLETPIYRRDDLAPGHVIVGPAVIEEYGATVPIHPRFSARVDAFGNLHITAEETP